MTIRRVSRSIAFGSGFASSVRKLSKFPCRGSEERPIMRRKHLLCLGLLSMKRVSMRLFPANSAAGRENAGGSAVLLVALALLAFPALPIAREANGSRELPVIGAAPQFTLTSQVGKPFALADLRGKAVVVAFIYTGCPDICPMLTQKMVEIQDELG